MTKYLALYTFHRADAASLHRLISLKKNNPEVTIIPCFGFSQNNCFPKKLRPQKHVFNPALPNFVRSAYFSNLTRLEKRAIESVRRQAEIGQLKKLSNKLGLKLHCDFTPFGQHNQDLAIINWFLSKGNMEDFDVMVYLEYDVLVTQTIETLYDQYARYDAGFVNYAPASKTWVWSSVPEGALASMEKWLKDRNHPSLPYCGFFPGHFLSRKVLDTLSKEWLPSGAFCELRLPATVTGLGFSVARLEFPKIRYRPPYSREEVVEQAACGIFHPFYDDFNINLKGKAQLKAT